MAERVETLTQSAENRILCRLIIAATYWRSGKSSLARIAYEQTLEKAALIWVDGVPLVSLTWVEMEWRLGRWDECDQALSQGLKSSGMTSPGREYLEQLKAIRDREKTGLDELETVRDRWRLDLSYRDLRPRESWVTKQRPTGLALVTDDDDTDPLGMVNHPPNA